MRQRSKSCFVSPDEVRKLNDEDNKETNDIISVDTFDNVITQIISQIPQNDEEPFEERLEKIKWKKIQINQHPYKKIKELVHSAIEKVRKHRILLEVLEDAKLAFKTQNSKVDDIKTVINKFHLDEPKKKKETVRTPFFDYYDEIKNNGGKYLLDFDRAL
ncbi:uncharacterized protein LOC129609262 [Condylostylus longicornis]|uniref:uncharacterized protein LOC129609262 n=1 Tax=Condylostylus longicornis TaxID=2530218 RepID=UPI00244DCDC3|nr:uncharacterized protein LOC129609262 [Condylostylus longicornis]